MKLRAQHRTIISAVRPNAGVAAAYRKALLQQIERIGADVEDVVVPIYKKKLGLDATLRGALAGLRRRWLKNFDGIAPQIAESFAQNAMKHTDLAFNAALSKGGFTVPFRLTPKIQMELVKRTKTNVDLIKTIPEEFFRDVHKAVFDSVKAGRDLSALTEHLHHAYDVTRRRAAFIARDQNNKATASIHQLRQLELGITQGRWRHTAASVTPRPEHQDFDGQEYDVATGHDFDDELGPVLPGEAYNCGCVGESIIPGFDGEDGEQSNQGEER